MKNIFLILFTILFLHVEISTAMDNDDPLLYKVTFENFEYQTKSIKTFSWDSDISIGYSLNKIIFYSEGEDTKYASSESENQLVYSHAISPYLDIQAGIAYDNTDESDYTWGVIALSGMLPYFVEIRAALLIGNNENIGLRLEADYEALITQKLILMPTISTSIYSKDVASMELIKGVHDITIGVRLKYELKREFAPYFGFEWSKNEDSYILIGLSFWF
ncbi:copper resistance protein B [Sulfurimonas sp.]|nr:copper resistance protein B [Sulfurimonas sp.]